MRYTHILFLFAIIALTSCERDKEEAAVKRVPIKETLPVLKIDKIAEGDVDLFTQTTVINSQEELAIVFSRLEISNYDEINNINYEENTLLVRFFFSFNSQPVPSVAHSLYYHTEEKYYDHYLHLESPHFEETDKFVFYCTGIVIDKIENSYIKTHTN